LEKKIASSGKSRLISKDPVTVRPTLTQVAKKAGVKVSSASEILNRKANCWSSQATRERVFAAAKELGYRPNQTARSLRSGKTKTLGVIITSHSYSGRMAGLDQAAYANNYAVILTFNANDPVMEDQLILNHLDRGVDGLIVYPSDSGPHTELKKLVEQGFPVVTFNGVGLDFECDDVSPDYICVGRLQARNLLEIGRRRICIATTTPSALINDIREEGVRRELQEHGLQKPMTFNIKYADDNEAQSSEILYPQIVEFITMQKGEFDSIIAFDAIAAMAARAILENGLQIPDDVAIVGAGNSVLSSQGILPLTSIDTSDEWIGMKAFQLVTDRIDGKLQKNKFERIISNSNLIIRQSTVKKD
jgi:LacI family transcriptional regulator